MLVWLHWSAIRAPILPIAWVLAHTTVLLWKAELSRLSRRLVGLSQAASAAVSSRAA
jgi:hypothetical protein